MSILQTVIFVVLFCVIMYAIKRTIKHCDYDERQNIVRGNAYKAAFFACTILDAVIIILAANDITIMTSAVAAALHLYVGMFVFSSYCVVKDAYFTASDKSVAYSLLIAVVGIINLIGGIVDAGQNDIIENGQLTRNCFGLLIGLTFITLSIIFAVKIALNRLEVDDE